MNPVKSVGPSRGGATGPHANQPVITEGPPPAEADATIILMHGRGASAESMLGLYSALAAPNVAAIAPQAAGHTWYPHSFLAPLESNQPYLDSALSRLDAIINDLLAGGVASGQIVLLGFSQGACLSTEYVACHPRAYGAVLGLSGGLIGPPGTVRNYSGSLAGTPVFLGAAAPDPHVPFERVKETATVLSAMGAQVDLRRYPGMPHTVNDEELEACQKLLQRVIDSRKGRMA